MHFSLYIAKRYLRSASKNNAINIINWIASIGIIVGAMALFVVLSVFSGLRTFSLSFSNDFDPDLKAVARMGKSFTISPQQRTQLRKIDGIQAASTIIEERVLFVFNGKEQVAYLKGVDSLFPKVNDVSKIIYQGDWLDPKTAQVVVGNGISQKLSMGLLDFNNPFEVYVPRPGKGAIDNPSEAFNTFVLAPVGLYAINEELDDKYVFCELQLAQALLEFKPNRITGIEIKRKPGVTDETLREALETVFPNMLSVKSRAQLNDSLYKMLNTENLAVYLIFTLVIIIALFNLVGALIMMILDKKANLKTLYDLGVEIPALRRIFLLQGSLLSLLGGLFGLGLGALLVFLQQRYNFIMITPSLPYPVELTIQNVLVVFATITLLGFLASWIASSRINKKLLQPAA